MPQQQDKSWAELLGLSTPEEYADLARRADEVIAATRRKGLDEMYRRVFADCEHERTHIEVRHGTTDQRRYVETCDDCTVQLREADA